MEQIKHPIIAVWAHPRSRSTALERVFLEREDFEVLHEPFSLLYYLVEGKGSAIPEGNFEANEYQYPVIRERILQKALHSPVFFKEMPHHCYEHMLKDEKWLSLVKHSFLIREPAESLASFYAMDPDFTEEEAGYVKQLALFRLFLSKGIEPVVIHAKDLVQRPQATLRAYCSAMDIPFDEGNLNWKKTPPDTWKVWGKWHKDAETSQGIQQKTKRYTCSIHNTAKLAALNAQFSPMFEEMLAHKLIP